MKLKSLQQRLNFFLNEISPVTTNAKVLTFEAILEFLFVFLFVFIFEPYIIKQLTYISKIEVAVVSAFIFSTLSWLYYMVYYRNIDKSKWTFKKDIVRYVKILGITASFFMVYAYYALHYIYASEIKTSPSNFIGGGFLYILAIGVVFYFFAKFMAFINNQFFKANENETLSKDIYLTFYGKNKEEVIQTSVDKIIYIQATGHYLNFFLIADNGHAEVQVIRNSLNQIKNIITNCNNLYQCHRSFIVNKNFILTIEGNSQKAFLTFNNTKNKVPISRENYKILKNTYAFSENNSAFNENNHLKVI